MNWRKRFWPGRSKLCKLSSVFILLSHLLGVGLNSTLHNNNYRVEEELPSSKNFENLRICFSSSCSSHLLGARTAVENKIKFGVGLNSGFHNNNYQTVWLIFKKERWIEGEFEVWSFGVWSLNWTFVGCGRVQKIFPKIFPKTFS